MRKKRTGAVKMLKKETPIQLARRYGRRWRGRVRDKLHPVQDLPLSRGLYARYNALEYKDFLI